MYIYTIYSVYIYIYIYTHYFGAFLCILDVFLQIPVKTAWVGLAQTAWVGLARPGTAWVGTHTDPPPALLATLRSVFFPVTRRALGSADKCTQRRGRGHDHHVGTSEACCLWGKPRHAYWNVHGEGTVGSQ